MVTLNATDVATEDDLTEQAQQVGQTEQEATETTETEQVEVGSDGNGSTEEEPEEEAADASDTEGEEDETEIASGNSGSGSAVQPDDISLPVPGQTVTDEAQRDFDERKADLEHQVGQLAIEQVRLKNAIKANRKALAEITDDLERHLSRGPVRFPLLDRVIPQQPAAGQHDGEPQPAEAATDKGDHVDGKPVNEYLAEIPNDNVLPPGAVSSLSVHLLQTIESDGVTFGVRGTVVQAYLDEDGTTFLAYWRGDPDEEECECMTAELEAEEFEIHEEPTSEPTSESAVSFVAQSVMRAAADEGTWRADVLADVMQGKCGVTEKIIEILDGHNIRTMGDLADAPLRHGCELTQLKGITEARLAKIQAADAEYWAERKAAGLV